MRNNTEIKRLLNTPIDSIEGKRDDRESEDGWRDEGWIDDGRIRRIFEETGR